jgi:hypothetical protein
MKNCRKLHNEKPYNVYSSLYIIRIVKSEMMGWVVHVACMEGRDLHIKFW